MKTERTALSSMKPLMIMRRNLTGAHGGEFKTIPMTMMTGSSTGRFMARENMNGS